MYLPRIEYFFSNTEHSNMEYLNIRTYERSNLRTNQFLNFSEHSNIEHLNIRILANMRTFELSNNRILANIRTLNIRTIEY